MAVPTGKLQLPGEAARAEHGRAARRLVPRGSHAGWSAPATRSDPVSLLEQQERSRVPELVPIRHDRMLASPFAFYRGAAIVMAEDLATTPDTGLLVQCCGDAHLANFGGFAAPDRTVVFDMNDFDETHPGPFEWDVKRLGASFEIACRARGFHSRVARSIVRRMAESYRNSMATFAGMSNLDVWYARMNVEAAMDRWRDQLSTADVKRVERNVAKAGSRNSMKALGKLTRLVGDEFRIAADGALVVPISELLGSHADDLSSWLNESFGAYLYSLQPDRRHLLESYRIVDFARKVVGVGSVGTRCWIALLMGRDNRDPLFLQIKEAEASVLESHGPKGEYDNHGQRVVEGQRLLQAAGDVLLGWLHAEGVDGIERDFYVRQLWDWKLSPDLETMSPNLLAIYAELCGWTLARGHARSGDRIAIAAYLGSGDAFDRAIGDFSAAYADQNDADYEAACAAARSGRLAVSAASP
jgi:uncharacterized protein (DUF2252 family)